VFAHIGHNRMGLLDGHPHVTSRKSGRAVLIATVVLAMAPLQTCRAFVTSSSPGQVGKLRLNPSRLSCELPVPEPLVASDVIMHSFDSSWKVVSGVALLIGAAARCLSRGQRAQRAQRTHNHQRFSAVLCKAMPAGTLQTQLCKQVAACNNLLDTGVSMLDHWERAMIQVPYIPVGATADMPADIQSGPLYMNSEVPVLSADTLCGNSPAHRNIAGCARRAGKARCSSKRRRAFTSCCSTHAARRSVGARLQGVQHVEVQRMAYDPSCVKTKMQVALQISSRMHLTSYPGRRPPPQ